MALASLLIVCVTSVTKNKYQSFLILRYILEYMFIKDQNMNNSFNANKPLAYRSTISPA